MSCRIDLDDDHKQWSATIVCGLRKDAKPAMVCTANDLSAWKDFPKGLRVLLLDQDSSAAAELKFKLEAMDYIGERFRIPLPPPPIPSFVLSNFWSGFLTTSRSICFFITCSLYQSLWDYSGPPALFSQEPFVLLTALDGIQLFTDIWFWKVSYFRNGCAADSTAGIQLIEMFKSVIN